MRASARLSVPAGSKARTGEVFFLSLLPKIAMDDYKPAGNKKHVIPKRHGENIFALLA
jgi:hypothetical protein